MDLNDLRLLTAIGPHLISWRLNVQQRELTQLSSLTLAANIQYGWQHPLAPLWYFASSDGGGRNGPPGIHHHISTCMLDPHTGALKLQGRSETLASRPIHLTVDPSAERVLVAFNQPAALRVYGVGDDGNVGAEIIQELVPSAGNYPHQVKVTHDGKKVFSTALGQNPAPGRLEDPGSINIFDFANGQLKNHQLVAPNLGYGFGPRHLDFHPNGRWIYVSLERQNKVAMFEFLNSRLNDAPTFSKPLLSRPQVPGIKQIAGAVHVHPNGRFLYVVNRASDTKTVDGKSVFAGGENTLAVFALDETNGEPVLIQHVETQGYHCRAFHIDKSGRLLVAAHITGMNVKNGEEITNFPPAISVFKIGEDGLLHFDHIQTPDTGGQSMFWMAIDTH